MLPTYEQCIQILNSNNVTQNIQKHSALVARIAVHISELLNKRGYNLDVKMIEAAAVLHDIERSKPNHAEAGAAFLNGIGLPEIAEIVRQHMKLDEGERGRISEVTIVYLADKYACEDKVVDLSQRFERKRMVFANDPEALRYVEENYQIALRLKEMIGKEIGESLSLIEI